MAMDSPSGAVRTFRISSMLQVMGPPIAACVVTFIVVILIVPADTRGGMTLFLLPVFALAIGLGAWLSARSRLTISSQEIVYYGAGFQVRASWGNVAGWGKRVMGVETVECLILHQPGMEMSRWMSIGYKMMPASQGAALATGRPVPTNNMKHYADAVPVGLFDKQWRDGEIGDLIKRYAPQAFDNAIQ